MAIDIGSAAIDRTYSTTSENGYILKENPANASGTITSIQVYVNTAFTDFRVFTAYETDTNVFSSRDWEAIGALAPGLHTVEVSLEVEAGDYIGWYGTIGDGGKVEADISGTGYWHLSRATFAIPLVNVEFSFAADRTNSVYGTGAATGDLPAVTTQANTDIAPESLTGNGVMTSLGTATVTQHGHCWNTTQNPTTSDSKTTNGTAYQTGHFTSAITPLTVGATYYFKAYATNSYGTVYGSQVSNTMATAIGRRHWWVEKKDYHWFGEDGVEYKASGVGVASDHDIIPWLGF